MGNAAVQRHPQGILPDVAQVAPHIVPGIVVTAIERRIVAYPPGHIGGDWLPGVHKEDIHPPAEGLPYPFDLAAMAPEMVGVGENHLAAISGRWVIAVLEQSPVARRNPIGGR